MERLSRTRPRRPIPEVLRSARTVPAWPYRCEVTDHFAFDCVEPRSGDRLPPCEGHRAPPVFRRQVGFGRQPGSGRRLPTAATIFGDLLRGGMRHLASSSVICIGREPRRPDGPAAAEHQSGSRAGKGGHKPAGSRRAVGWPEEKPVLIACEKPPREASRPAARSGDPEMWGTTRPHAMGPVDCDCFRRLGSSRSSDCPLMHSFPMVAAHSDRSPQIGSPSNHRWPRAIRRRRPR